MHKKRLNSTLAKGFICELCVDTMERIVEPSEEIFSDHVGFVESFWHLRDRLNGSGRSEAEVTTRTRIEVLRGVLDFEVARKRGCREPNMTWKKQVEEHSN